MANQKTTIEISGMHCRSCEILIEEKLRQVPGISKVAVSQHKGIAHIFHEETLDLVRVEEAVTAAGYRLGRSVEKPFLSVNAKDYQDLVIAAVIALGLYFLARVFGLFNLSVGGPGGYSSLPVVLLVGLTAGFSTCMALVGGLVLGASVRYAEAHPSASSVQKFRPHLLFNAGRIGGFFILGGIIGLAGSVFQLSPLVLGLLTIIVGMVMLMLGLQLTGIFPAVKSMSVRLPVNFKLENPVLLGAVTFFLPCGFTQAMQLFAISSGSAVTGAVTMGFFAIGTAPGLLGIGGLTSIAKGTFGRLLFKTASLVILAMALFNLSNGFNLVGFNPGDILATMFSVKSDTTPAVVAAIENGVQTVNMTQDGSGYHPNSFNVKVGVPVKWVINSTDAYTCASSLLMPQYNIRRALSQGQNIIEFTPTEKGTIQFTCSMGMYRGVFNVSN
ncbi:sulfite exporter TauE/SafE family protein [Patescibacteria group bacterium]|nr:sulfite exporter TauE/SafE family protein [Patescibacteria group bacterium]